ncbi:hypothetical protein QOZ80_8AG0618830 [Eleusine coracana subsp. coracana]|nr:hypothetical protein QOZ80_8AG0618830 [Eleusine coracana subsp. coracana]
MAAASADGPEGSHPEEKTKRNKPSTFHPTLWGDFFLTYEPPTLAQKAQMHGRAGVLKEEVMKIIKSSNDLPEIVDLIITLERLSLDYHYEDEIKELLHVIYSSKYDSNNLNEVSTRFYLLRKSGYNVPSDDFIDTYSTTEESMQLAKAIFSWDECATSLLPEYIQDFYLYLLKTFCSFEDELGSEKGYRVFYLKQVLKQLVQSYIEELTWRDENYMPKTLSEHLGLSMRSSGGSPIVCASLVGMGKIVTKETLEWFLSYPPFVRSFDTFVRLSDDVASTEREQTGDHSVSTVQCYMKEHGTTMPEARRKIRELIEEQWKDMLQYHLTVGMTEQTMIVSWAVINFSRTGDYMYHKDIDKFTSSHAIKETIKSLFVEPMPV